MMLFFQDGKMSFELLLILKNCIMQVYLVNYILQKRDSVC